METKEIDKFYNLSSCNNSMELLKTLESRRIQPRYKELIDSIPNIDKLDDLYSSIDYDTEGQYYHITRFKNALSDVHKTLNYKFGLSFIYYHRIYKNWSLATCNKNMGIFLKFQQHLNFENINLVDVHNLFMKIKKSKHTQSTKSTMWRVLKQMIKFSGFNIDLSDFTIKKPVNTKKPEDLLTKEEFNAIVEGLGSHQYGKGLEYQTFFMFLADTGARTGEAFSIDKKKLVENKEGYFESIVSGKTGDRLVLLYHSTLMFKLLFMEGWEKWTFTYNAFRKQLKTVCERKKIGKRVYNHLLRHNFGSYIAQDERISKEVKNKFCGWSAGSTMLDTTYTHFSNRLVLDRMKTTLKDNPLFN